jgi:hypothetical protein
LFLVDLKPIFILFQTNFNEPTYSHLELQK